MRYPQMFLALVLIAVTVLAAPVTDTHAAIMQKKLSMEDIRQEQSMWCWAAVTQTIGRYKTGNRSITQCNIVSGQYSGCPNWGSINSGTIQAALTIQYRLNSTVSWRAEGFVTVMGAINGNSPVAIYWAWGSGGGHHVTIRGYYENTDTKVQNIDYLDPTPGATGGPWTKPYTWMVNDGSHTWTETLLNVRV